MKGQLGRQIPSNVYEMNPGAAQGPALSHRLDNTHHNRLEQLNKWSADASQTCSVWCDSVQFDSQGIAGLSVMLQGVTVAPAAIEEPLPTEHRSVCQVQPQVLPHLTLLTLPAADRRQTLTLLMGTCEPEFKKGHFHPCKDSWDLSKISEALWKKNDAELGKLSNNEDKPC